MRVIVVVSVLIVSWGAKPSAEQKPFNVGLAAEPPVSWREREVPLGPAGTLLDVSSDRTRVARVVKRDGKATLLVDTSESPTHGGVRFARFSPDGKQFAFIEGGAAKLRLVVDGVERFAWEGRKGAAVHGGFWFRGARWFLWAGEAGGWSLSNWYQLVADGNVVAENVEAKAWEKPFLLASENGRRFGYLAKRPHAVGNEAVTLLLRGPEGEQSQYPGVSPECRGCALSPDGQRVIYSIRRNDKWVLVSDGAESSEYEDLKWPVFSPDGSRLAVPVKRSGVWLVLLDGREEAASYEDMGEAEDDLGRTRSLFFSPDGKRLAILVRRRQLWVPVIDGVEGERYEELGAPVFSAEGKHVAYRAKKSGRWLVVADRREGPRYEEVAKPALALRGAHVAYAGKRGGKWYLVVDGIEGKEYEFLSDRTVVFDGPRELHALIRRGEEYARLEVEIRPVETEATPDDASSSPAQACVPALPKGSGK